jgi:hypothetical protein
MLLSIYSKAAQNPLVVVQHKFLADNVARMIYEINVIAFTSHRCRLQLVTNERKLKQEKPFLIISVKIEKFPYLMSAVCFFVGFSCRRWLFFCWLSGVDCKVLTIYSIVCLLSIACL